MGFFKVFYVRILEMRKNCYCELQSNSFFGIISDCFLRILNISALGYQK